MRASILPLLTLLACAQAQTPSDTIDAYAAAHREARSAQSAIEAQHARGELLRSERQLVEAQGTSFALQNRELETDIAGLQRNLRDLEDDLQAVAETQTGIVALLTGMTDALERFIELDLPFRSAERLGATAALRATLASSETSIAGKYQAVVSAYLTEIGHGSSNEVFSARIVTGQGERIVSVLRLGRAGLWYVTPDGQRAGRWHRRERRWIDDGHTDPAEVLRGIRMMRDEGPVTAIDLPVDIGSP